MLNGPPHHPLRHAVVDIFDTEIRKVATAVMPTGVPQLVTLPGTGIYLAQARLTTGAVVRRSFQTGHPGDCVVLDTERGGAHQAHELSAAGLFRPVHPYDADLDEREIDLSWWRLVGGHWVPAAGDMTARGGTVDAFATPDDGILALQLNSPGRPVWTTLMPPRAHAVVQAPGPDTVRAELPETLAVALLTFLDRGDVASAQHVAERLRSGKRPVASLIDDLATAYLSLRTDARMDPAPLEDLRSRYPFSSDAALLHGWHAGSIGRHPAAATTALDEALELGPPVVRLGLRMLYDGLNLLHRDTSTKTARLRQMLHHSGKGPLTTFRATAATALWPPADSTRPPRRRQWPSPGEDATSSSVMTEAWTADLAQCLTQLNRTGFVDAGHRLATSGAVRVLAWLDPDDEGTHSLSMTATPAPSTQFPPVTLALTVSAHDHRLAAMDHTGRAVFHRVSRRRWTSFTVLPSAPRPGETPLPTLATGSVSANDGEDIVQSISAPYAGVQFTVATTDSPGRYTLELTLHTTTSRPRIVPLSYRTVRGDFRNLLVACRYQIVTKGATSAAVCTDVDPHVGWTLHPPIAPSELIDWGEDIPHSVAAAANKATREAWVAAGEYSGNERIRRLINDGLPG
ncbi:hypothetical protein [Streptomyces sp. CdTB01]|uniref:hypothetical protein n=1 Tax=Streptomyces sp. CdTB01 TaxID=1725411 RepID=UPI00131EDD79|nr:hypothetical protein [Streptomyces sp. CdTB01]